ncbi:MAG TPA: amino acid ABC transporter ATP-binding protein [Microbacteriaceae bacterium]|nr:amino acid ABC transporter ATP-binding protein [Microbacteriaceae bacterium]
MPGPLLELSHVSKRFGSIVALDDVSLEVARGETVVVLGASGSGKSSLCRIIPRLEVPDSGTVSLSGQPIPLEGKGLYRARSEMGFVFQAFNLFEHLAARDNVALALRHVAGLSAREARERADIELMRVGLGGRESAFPAQLSGGQQQRVAIARALALRPKLLIFDEPTSALDPAMVSEVLEVMVQLASRGTTMLVVTHEMGFARSAADRIVFMDAGRIVEDAPPTEFFTRPRSLRAQAFLAHAHSRTPVQPTDREDRP